MKKLFTIALAAVLLGACGGKSPESAADSLTKAWAAGDFETMFKYADDGLKAQLEFFFESRREHGEYEEYVQRIVDNKWTFAIDGKPEYNDDGELIIKYRVEGKKGPADHNATVRLRQVDGKWKAVMFGAPYYE